jgi:DNA-binding CsgD family transcriptional regulator/PAS domain-containing protein
MERLRLAELRTLSEFLRALYAPRPLSAFVEHALAALPGVVSSELTVYGELNPRRNRYLFVERPENVETPARHPAFRPHFHQHPFLKYPLGGGHGDARKISDVLTKSAWHRLALYNEAFRPTGIDCEMVVWLPARPPTMITFAVHRSGSDFTPQNRFILNLLRPHLIQAYQNAAAFTELDSERSQFRHVTEEVGGRGVILLTHAGRIRYANAQARRSLSYYFDRARARDTLPEPIRRWAAHHDRSFIRVQGLPPLREPLVREREGKRLVIRLLSHDPDAILLLEEQPTDIDPICLEPLGLSRREAEVLAWIAQGKTNGVIATILGISPNTVARHVEHILATLGVETRTAAAAQALAVVWGRTEPQVGPQTPRI